MLSLRSFPSALRGFAALAFALVVLAGSAPDSSRGTIEQPAPAALGVPQEIVFIDGSVQDSAVLAAGVRPGVETVLLDSASDELAQIDASLRKHRGLTAVHIVSHGAPGAIRLGRRRLDATVLSALDMVSWRSAMTQDAAVLVYGCDVARGAAGRRFMATLAQRTGAKVAASTDLTGAASEGGDWLLEAQSGRIHVAALFDATRLAAFRGTLSDATFKFGDSDSGTMNVAESTTSGYISTSELTETIDSDSLTIVSTNAGSNGLLWWGTAGYLTNDAAGYDFGGNETHWGGNYGLGFCDSMKLTGTSGKHFNLKSLTILGADYSGDSTFLVIFTTSNGYSTWVTLTAKTAQTVTLDSNFEDIASVTISAQDSSGNATTFCAMLDNIALTNIYSPEINSAPTLSGGPFTLTSTDENTTSSATLVSTILAGLTYSDSNTSASTGIAVTATTGNGTWQYSIDGLTWTGFGSVSDTSSLLLKSSTYLRYVPDAENGETATLTFRAWDRTSGTIGSKVDTSTNGGTSAFSTGKATANLTVVSINDAPVVTAPTSIAVLEDQTTALTGISFSDADAGSSSVVATYSVGSGTLAATSGSSVTVSGSGTTVLTLSGSIADLNTFIAGGAVTFTTASNATADVTLTIGIDDNGNTGSGGSLTDAQDVTIAVTAVNDAPTVTTSSGSAAFTAGDNVASTPVAVDSGLTVADVDNTALASATVAITGSFQSSEDVLTFTNTSSTTYGNISASYNSATGVLTLASAGATATVAQWQAALRAVTYTSSAVTPNTATRTISFVVNDDISSSVAATRTVTVAAVDQTPLLSTSGGSATFTENGGAVTVDGGLTLSDLDNTTLASATVSITGNLSSSEDMLAFNNTGATTYGNIGASYSSATGVLTLTSVGAAATLAQWQAVLRAVTYTNSSEIPNTSARTLAFIVNDGAKNSAAATRQLTVTAVNDAPSITVPTSVAVTEDTATAVTSISVSDVDSSSGILTLSVSSGALSATSSGTVTVGGTSTSLTLSGTMSDITNFIAGNGVTFTPVTDATGDVTLTSSISDGALSASGTTTLSIGAVNDAPTFTKGANQTVLENAGAQSVSGWATAISAGPSNESGQTVSFTVSNDNNALFSSQPAVASGGTLTYTPAANATGTATVTISANDDGGTANGGDDTSDAQTFTIAVTPPRPMVTSVSSTTADGTYKAGATIAVTVTFDQAVTVDTTGGTPTLALETGSTDRLASYDSGSGSGSATLSFNYTVQSGDTSADLDYASTSALALNGATIRNAPSLDAILALPAVGGASSLAGQKALAIDTTAPSAPTIAAASATTVTGYAEPGSTVTVYVDGSSTAAGTAVANATTGLWTCTLGSSLTVGTTHSFTATATDAAGNSSTTSAAYAVTVAASGSTWIVTVNTDSTTAPAAGSLRYAVNNAASGDTILFALTSGSETITIGAALAISAKSLTIDGSNTATSGSYTGNGTAVTVTVPTPGTSTWRVFNLDPGTGNTVALSDLTLRGGNLSSVSDRNGGVIYCASGTTTLTDVTVSKGHVLSYGGGLYVANGATAMLTNSTCSDNATGESGGGIYLDEGATATLLNTTLSGNSADYRGGGLCVWSSATATLVDTTLSGNSGNYGGGLYVAGTATLLNTIVVNNTVTASGGDLFNAGGTLNAYACWYAAASGTIAIATAAPNVTDAYTTGDLGPLADNGGATPTMALSASAPAYGAGVSVHHNATVGYYFKGSDGNYYKVTAPSTMFAPGDPTGDLISTDQRGAPRVAPLPMGACQPGIGIASVTVPTAGNYKAGVDLTFTVTFNDTVTVAGTPRLVLTIGSSTCYAGYVSGTDPDILTFTYTVQAGDNDTDGIAVVGVDLNGGTIDDSVGYAADLTLPTLTTGGILVDTTAPTAPAITGRTSTTLSGTGEAGSTVKIYDGTTRLGSATVASDGTWTITVGLLSGGAHHLTATATDAAGNAGSALAFTFASSHTADLDGNWALSLTELLRMIELYNTWDGPTRTGAYHTDDSSADGCATGAGTIAVYHSADTDHSGTISLTELLRVIELYNTATGTTRTGAYHEDVSTEDGFATGAN